MDQLVQFLTGHERAVFINGRFGFDVRPHPLLLALFALLFVAFVYFVYVRPRARLGRNKLAGLVALRTALFALLAFMLLKPVVTVPSIVPRSTSVALLVDDSRSMQMGDMPGRQSRLDAVKAALLTPEGDFLKRLEERFRTDLYGFAGELTKIKGGGELFGEGASSDLAGAVSQAARRATGAPLSAVVLVSDGAANVPRDLAAELRNLRARGVPVYTVGLGSTARPTDAELVRVSLPRRVLVGSTLEVEAYVRASGYGPTKIRLAASEDGRAVKTEEVALRGGETEAVRIELTPATSGWHRYTFDIQPLEGELTVENNRREALVEVIEGPMRVLYVEGEPRWEHGKMRTALGREEKNVELVSILRTGENKLYRQGVSGEQELVSGFPATEDELFAYDGLVVGSVEASFFSVEQMRAIEAFVARRGGGLLALGGRLGFDAGKYAGTPLADLLPLALGDRAGKPQDASGPVYKPQLTPRGAAHPIARLNEDRAASQKIWNELPPVSVPEEHPGVKPGATVLVEGRRAGGDGKAAGSPVPLLAVQRYGRGHALAFAASDTWRWRMKMDSKSNAHETFWRQMLRYLVSISPRQNEVQTAQDVYGPGDTVQIVADLRDRKFQPAVDARAAARVFKPSGASVDVPLRFTARDDANVYVGEFRADELGRHRVEVTASGPSLGEASAQSEFLVAELNREFYDAAQNDALLKRIAAETVGKYYTLEEAGRLVDDLTYRKSDHSRLVTKDLWDMPVNFLLLVALVSAEWFIRKREGLA
ncbi:MAG TPA: vWA domain-containing protein [Pyrinomonadaceae bacterium]|nr:vWA domain-containing protein [Pyrinomonadaceae bacterium]